ncbi:hypothetical protein [Yaniella halotolerans]|uniref:hypothetical protein n=1 Tax=Yaniella halotolerans TaxID=225453 RepID=UPI0003B70FCB|nr:hypothetical protein [Yaniella halotolerans]
MSSSSSSLSVIDIPEHCGNAPRKVVIRDFLIALYSGAVDETLGMLKDDVRWEIVGSNVLSGQAETRAWLMNQDSTQELKLHTVITHGTDCGADGVATYAQSRAVCFNHVILFAGHGKAAKIKEIRSYLIES